MTLRHVQGCLALRRIFCRYFLSTSGCGDVCGAIPRNKCQTSCLPRPCHRVISQPCRHFSAGPELSPHIAIIGSGPAGFYTAQHILKSHPSAQVDIYEKLPVPFGLVRFGVAPDHPDVKNVINTFTQTASNERCNFLGNVCVGLDVSVEQLRKSYAAVIFAYGSEDDKQFGIPGEDLEGVVSARRFVGWYNGLPQDRHLDVNLDAEEAAVLGQGNVAIDVARILLTPVDILKTTDITEYAMEAISKSRIKKVYLIGRRGPLQVAFTIAELREMTRLAKSRPVIKTSDCQGLDDLIKDLPRPRRRLTELLWKTACGVPSPADASRWAEADREWELVFHRSPQEFIASADGRSVHGIRLGINTLEGPIGVNQKAVPTGETEVLNCDLVFRSIGYKTIPLDDHIPFDKSTATIPNKEGRVLNGGNTEKGLYCSGWVKRGPVGVIVSTMTDAFETGKMVVNDLNSGELEPTADQRGKETILQIVRDKGIQVVDFSAWKKIDEAETKAGSTVGKPREKMVNTEEMLQVAGS